MKMSRAQVMMALITMMIGFLIVIQYKTVQDPVVRDSRNMWELRDSVSKELELQSKLLTEVRTNDELIDQYESKIKDSKKNALEQASLDLRKEAGLTEYKGPGVTLTIEPLSEVVTDGDVEFISPIILQRLVNELNINGAKQIAIDGVRIVNTTVIREINGETKVGDHTLRTLPFTIDVVTNNKAVADKLYKRMQVSPSVEDFFIDNLKVSITDPQETIVVPAHVDPIHIHHLELVEDKGES